MHSYGPASGFVRIWVADGEGVRRLGSTTNRETHMSIGTILLIILILALIGVLPTWGHSRSWGYGPTGGLGIVVVILIILLVMGKI
jgi:uncharacterized protein DUF3309